jgi:hypothetical protein
MWKNLNFLVGSWRGSGSGQPGISQVERSYQFVLNGKFLEARNKSTWAPKNENLEGEVHEDFGLISYDSARKAFILRQFHVEGFVNQYVMDFLAPDGNTIVFTSESIENIPAGWRARETFRVVNSDEFTEIFELVAPGKTFDLYSSSHLMRIP